MFGQSVSMHGVGALAGLIVGGPLCAELCGMVEVLERAEAHGELSLRPSHDRPRDRV